MGGVDIGEMLTEIHQIAGIELTEAEKATFQDNDSLPMNREQAPDWIENEVSTTVNLLESDERLDADPMLPIMKAVKQAQVGELLLIKHKWELQPLYDVWAKTGVDTTPNGRQKMSGGFISESWDLGSDSRKKQYATRRGQMPG